MNRRRGGLLQERPGPRRQERERLPRKSESAIAKRRDKCGRNGREKEQKVARHRMGRPLRMRTTFTSQVTVGSIGQAQTANCAGGKKDNGTKCHVGMCNPPLTICPCCRSLLFFAGQPIPRQRPSSGSSIPNTIHTMGTIGEAQRAAFPTPVKHVPRVPLRNLFVRTEVLPPVRQGWAARNGDEIPTALHQGTDGTSSIPWSDGPLVPSPPPQPSRETNSDHGHSSMPLAMLHDVRRISKRPQDRTCGDSAS